MNHWHLDSRLGVMPSMATSKNTASGRDIQWLKAQGHYTILNNNMNSLANGVHQLKLYLYKIDQTLLDWAEKF